MIDPRVPRHSTRFLVLAFLFFVSPTAFLAVDPGWCWVSQATPAAEEMLPKFGEYVYIEELPEAIRKASPLYPDLARQSGVEGTVMVQALVGKDGRVKDTKIVKSIPMLDQAAVDCVRQWVFKPALSKNQPVAVWVAVPIRFGSGNESPAPREREAPPPPPRETRARSIATRATLPEMLQRLRARGPVAPSDDDALLRERIIRTARRDAPEVPRLALESVQHARGTQDAPPEDRLRDLTLALDAAPWWAEPYREVGFVLIEMGRRAEARVSLELYLVADPDAYDWESVRLILNDLRRRIIDSN